MAQSNEKSSNYGIISFMKARVSRRKEGLSSSSVHCAFSAITVGSGRAAEPYIIAFHYKSDNVAGKPLGTLFGFFEVEVHDEDAAYIVNFLASVAKKEYFTNPRREVNESFETTLHKINVALAELAKEGNVSWLGHLHGILGAVSEGTVHFSATGDGVLALVRENSLRPISDGLAEVTSEPHPLKTFTEVSSGKLLPNDVLLALSPAVWTLFTPEDLKKNLVRLGNAGFEQFLRTALINELPVAGAVMVKVTAVDLPASSPHTKPMRESASADLANVWSGRVFEKVREAKQKAFSQAESADQDPPPPPTEEYIDKKTGHIYVQGETDPSEAEESLWQAKAAFWFQSLGLSWQVRREKIRRYTRRSRKTWAFFTHALWAGLHQLTRRSTRRLRSWWRQLHREKAKHPVPLTPLTEALDHEPGSILNAAPAVPEPDRAAWQPRIEELKRSFASFAHGNWHEKFRTLPTRWRHLFTTSKHQLLNLFRLLSLWWMRQHPKRRKILAGAGLMVVSLLLGSWFYIQRSPLWNEQRAEAPSLSESTAPLAPTPPPLTEPLAVPLNQSRPLTASTGEPLALGSINALPLDIRTERITNTQTGETTAFPEPMRLATVMDDLDAVFLIGRSGALYIFTLANKKFEQNTLLLPAGGQIDAIATYLTYLYVLDRKAGIVYRFPRAEGGFGTATAWSKETLSVHPLSPLVVFENVALVLPDGHPALYTRGRKTETTFAGTNAPLETKALALDTRNGDVYALDPKAKRVVRWSSTGTLIAQYLNDAFADAHTLAVTNTNELLIALPSGTIAFPLP